MNLQGLIAIFLRLTALNFFLQAALQLTPQLLRLTQISRQIGSTSLATDAAVPILVVIGLVVGAILTWLFALPIAGFVTRGVSGDLSFGSLALVDCYSIAFIGTGLFYMVSHFPHVVNWAHYLFTAAASHPGSRWKEGVPWYKVSSAVIPFIVGIVMFINGRAWAVALARRHEDSASARQPLERTRTPPGTSDPQ